MKVGNTHPKQIIFKAIPYLSIILLANLLRVHIDITGSFSVSKELQT